MKKLPVIAAALVSVAAGCASVEQPKEATALSAFPLLSASELAPGTILHKNVTPKTVVVTDAYQNAEEKILKNFASKTNLYHQATTIAPTTEESTFAPELPHYKMANSTVNVIDQAKLDEIEEYCDEHGTTTNGCVIVSPKTNAMETVEFEINFDIPNLAAPIILHMTNNWNYVASDMNIFTITNTPAFFKFKQIGKNTIMVERSEVKAPYQGSMVQGYIGRGSTEAEAISKNHGVDDRNVPLH